MSNWEWKQPKGHELQPRVEWWLEQVAVIMCHHIFMRAHKRGDLQTRERMYAVAKAGADAEKAGAL